MKRTKCMLSVLTAIAILANCACSKTKTTTTKTEPIEIDNTSERGEESDSAFDKPTEIDNTSERSKESDNAFDTKDFKIVINENEYKFSVDKYFEDLSDYENIACLAGQPIDISVLPQNPIWEQDEKVFFGCPRPLACIRLFNPYVSNRYVGYDSMTGGNRNTMVRAEDSENGIQLFDERLDDLYVFGFPLTIKGSANEVLPQYEWAIKESKLQVKKELIYSNESTTRHVFFIRDGEVIMCNYAKDDVDKTVENERNNKACETYGEVLMSFEQDISWCDDEKYYKRYVLRTLEYPISDIDKKDYSTIPSHTLLSDEGIDLYGRDYIDYLMTKAKLFSELKNGEAEYIAEIEFGNYLLPENDDDFVSIIIYSDYRNVEKWCSELGEGCSPQTQEQLNKLLDTIERKYGEN